MSGWRPLPDEVVDPRPVADSLPGLTRALGVPAPSVLGTLFSHWEEIVGPTIATEAWPVSVREGVLRIGVEHPGWATQLRFLGPDVVRRVAAVTGDEAVQRIEVKVLRRPQR